VFLIKSVKARGVLDHDRKERATSSFDGARGCFGSDGRASSGGVVGKGCEQGTGSSVEWRWWCWMRGWWQQRSGGVACVSMRQTFSRLPITLQSMLHVHLLRGYRDREMKDDL
jgi:hypothetical protein